MLCLVADKDSTHPGRSDVAFVQTSFDLWGKLSYFFSDPSFKTTMCVMYEVYFPSLMRKAMIRQERFVNEQEDFWSKEKV